MSDFETKLSERRNEFERELRRYAPEMTGEASLVREAMNYSLLAGGKRLRPIILTEVYALLGGNRGDIVFPFAVAIEMIHTYSLVHDDLPAMDNDDFRRGRPTNHNIYGEAIAILAGDGLLNCAMETAAEALKRCMTVEEYRAAGRALRTLFKASGTYGMIGGQTLDISVTDKSKKTAEFFETMYGMKTGALIKASFVVGALLADKRDEAEKFGEIGGKLGLAFQLQDDLLDISGDEAKLGKAVNRDKKNDKLTYVRILGEDKSRGLIKSLINDAKESLNEIVSRCRSYDGFLTELIEYFENRDR